MIEEDSVTFEVFMARGQVREARKMVLRMGRIKFGQPADPETEAALNRMTNLEQLEALGDRLIQVSTWQELLATP